jgi:hypothetical protein
MGARSYNLLAFGLVVLSLHTLQTSIPRVRGFHIRRKNNLQSDIQLAQQENKKLMDQLDETERKSSSSSTHMHFKHTGAGDFRNKKSAKVVLKDKPSVQRFAVKKQISAKPAKQRVNKMVNSGSETMLTHRFAADNENDDSKTPNLLGGAVEDRPVHDEETLEADKLVQKKAEEAKKKTLPTKEDKEVIQQAKDIAQVKNNKKEDTKDEDDDMGGNKDVNKIADPNKSQRPEIDELAKAKQSFDEEIKLKHTIEQDMKERSSQVNGPLHFISQVVNSLPRNALDKKPSSMDPVDALLLYLPSQGCPKEKGKSTCKNQCEQTRICIEDQFIDHLQDGIRCEAPVTEGYMAAGITNDKETFKKFSKEVLCNPLRPCLGEPFCTMEDEKSIERRVAFFESLCAVEGVVPWAGPRRSAVFPPSCTSLTIEPNAKNQVGFNSLFGKFFKFEKDLEILAVTKSEVAKEQLLAKDDDPVDEEQPKEDDEGNPELEKEVEERVKEEKTLSPAPAPSDMSQARFAETTSPSPILTGDPELDPTDPTDLVDVKVKVFLPKELVYALSETNRANEESKKDELSDQEGEQDALVANAEDNKVMSAKESLEQTAGSLRSSLEEVMNKIEQLNKAEQHLLLDDAYIEVTATSTQKLGQDSNAAPNMVVKFSLMSKPCPTIQDGGPGKPSPAIDKCPFDITVTLPSLNPKECLTFQAKLMIRAREDISHDPHIDLHFGAPVVLELATGVKASMDLPDVNRFRSDISINECCQSCTGCDVTQCATCGEQCMLKDVDQSKDELFDIPKRMAKKKLRICEQASSEIRFLR